MSIFRNKTRLYNGKKDKNELHAPVRTDSWRDTLMKKIPVGARQFLAGVAMASVLATASYSPPVRADNSGIVLTVNDGAIKRVKDKDVDIKIDINKHDLKRLFSRFIKNRNQKRSIYRQLNDALFRSALDLKRKILSKTNINKNDISLNDLKKILLNELKKDFRANNNCNNCDLNAFEEMAAVESKKRRRKLARRDNQTRENMSRKKSVTRNLNIEGPSNSETKISKKQNKKVDWDQLYKIATDEKSKGISQEIINKAKKNNIDFDKKDKDGKTLLMLAAKRGWQNTCERLIKAGADVNVRDKNGKTALMHAIEKLRSLTALRIYNSSENDIDLTITDNSKKTVSDYLDISIDKMKEAISNANNEKKRRFNNAKKRFEALKKIVDDANKPESKKSNASNAIASLSTSTSSSSSSPASSPVSSPALISQPTTPQTAEPTANANVYAIPFVHGFAGVLGSPHPASATLKVADLSFGAIGGYEITDNFGIAVMGSAKVKVHGFEFAKNRFTESFGLGMHLKFGNLMLIGLGTLELRNSGDDAVFGAILNMSHPTFNITASTNFNRSDPTVLTVRYHDLLSNYPVIIDGSFVNASYEDLRNKADDIVQLARLRLQFPLGYNLPAYANIVLGGFMNRIDASPYAISQYGGEIGLSLTWKYINFGLAYLPAHVQREWYEKSDAGSGREVSSESVEHGIGAFAGFNVPFSWTEGSVVNGGLDFTYIGNNLVIIPQLNLLIRW